ncbi:cupin domain-containing protein [Paenibacillus vietnamensis]|uniref:cupin domain-containing protein n=1 Tax=Paenibacillus vietnamensis TaxID=2590547 RepID=UPI001CD10F4C|nr:cupin domain-containing protein [Paenibacillus vietnamensis]
MSKLTAIPYKFNDDGQIPNNPDLPLLVYPGAMKDEPGRIEAVFNRNNWRNSWTNGVYGYHHYHSNSHEVLGVQSGSAAIQAGGEHGKSIELGAGDVIVLPAGTGHKLLTASPDFKVVGAYPDGMEYNLLRSGEGKRPDVLEEIRRVPLPDTDPLFGADGPLIELWKKGSA